MCVCVCVCVCVCFKRSGGEEVDNTKGAINATTNTEFLATNDQGPQQSCVLLSS